MRDLRARRSVGVIVYGQGPVGGAWVKGVPYAGAVLGALGILGLGVVRLTSHTLLIELVRGGGRGSAVASVLIVSIREGISCVGVVEAAIVRSSGRRDFREPPWPLKVFDCAAGRMRGDGRAASVREGGSSSGLREVGRFGGGGEDRVKSVGRAVGSSSRGGHGGFYVIVGVVVATAAAAVVVVIVIVDGIVVIVVAVWIGNAQTTERLRQTEVAVHGSTGTRPDQIKPGQMVPNQAKPETERQQGRCCIGGLEAEARDERTT